MLKKLKSNHPNQLCETIHVCKITVKTDNYKDEDVQVKEVVDGNGDNLHLIQHPYQDSTWSILYMTPSQKNLKVNLRQRNIMKK